MSNGFSERLRKIRRQKKLTQTQIGNLIGVSYNHIGRYERGLSQPTSATLTKLAEALGVTGDWLMHGIGEDLAGEVPVLKDPLLLSKFREVERLPAGDRQVLVEVIDAFLVRRKVKDLAAI